MQQLNIMRQVLLEISVLMSTFDKILYQGKLKLPVPWSSLKEFTEKFLYQCLFDELTKLNWDPKVIGGLLESP